MSKKADANKQRATNAYLMQCEPGVYSKSSEQNTLITFGSPSEVQLLALNLEDSRKLVVRLLSSLWTADDEFAGKVLEEHFSIGRNGLYVWPEQGGEEVM